MELRKEFGIPNYLTFNDISELNTAPKSEAICAIYIGNQSIALNSIIKINSAWKNIDFNGATITLGSLPKTGVSAITGHSYCMIRNLIIKGDWTVNSGVVSNVMDTFAGIENVSMEVKINGSHYGRGFHSCQRLKNCKVVLSGNNFTSGRCYSFCEFLDNCRCGKPSGGSNATGFYHCTGMNNCDIYENACDHKIEECSNYTNLSYYVNGERTYFSDIDNSHSRNLYVNGYNLKNFANTISVVNYEDSKVLVHPNGGSGVSEVTLSKESVGESVVRRDSTGRIHSSDGHYDSVLCTIDYVNSYVQTLENSEIDKIFN